jgi:hypothetical protein
VELTTPATLERHCGGMGLLQGYKGAGEEMGETEEEFFPTANCDTAIPNLLPTGPSACQGVCRVRRRASIPLAVTHLLGRHVARAPAWHRLRWAHAAWALERKAWGGRGGARLGRQTSS